MDRTLIFGLSALLAASPVLAESAPKTFELSEGRFTELPAAAPTTLPAPEPALKNVERLIDLKQFNAAHRQALGWLLAHKADPNYPFGLFLLAQGLNGDDEPIEAFYYCDELLDNHPASTYYAGALDLQYAIADSLLNGRKVKSAGLKIFSGTDDAIEMLFRIRERAPGSPLSERALRRTADFYFSDGQFDLAADAYGAYAKAYARSPNYPEILLRQAFSNYAQFTGLRFDPTPLVNARTQMNEMVNKYPEAAERENIPAFIDSIDKTLARKLATTADFYRRTGKPGAEKAIQRTLVEQFPQSDEAQRARAQLEKAGG
ncbi:MAG TPA: outer membrane protein assembly factor BamD [Tepidisphaeraceae bacterium]|jgi:tetratricopeptide (TPR) repeat protein